MPSRSIYERFYALIQPDELSLCWLWKGAKSNNLKRPYGYFTYGKVQYAHRVAWQIFRGPIPDGLFVLHHCDNPPCVNPDHLFLGTKKDNRQDMLRKNRYKFPVGEATPSAKLTEVQVRQILTDARSQRLIANEYGINQSQVSRIKSAKRWSHL